MQGEELGTFSSLDEQEVNLDEGFSFDLNLTKLANDELQVEGTINGFVTETFDPFFYHMSYQDLLQWPEDLIIDLPYTVIYEGYDRTFGNPVFIGDIDNINFTPLEDPLLSSQFFSDETSFGQTFGIEYVAEIYLENDVTVSMPINISINWLQES
jgi:hypothetical protein